MRLIRVTLLLALGGWAYAPASDPAASLPPPGAILKDASRVVSTLPLARLSADMDLLSAESAAAFIGVFGMLGLIRRRRRGIGASAGRGS